MIVRAVLTHPELIERFDWFNDGQNTINWLKWVKAPAELVAKMEEKLQLYHKERLRK